MKTNLFLVLFLKSKLREKKRDRGREGDKIRQNRTERDKDKQEYIQTHIHTCSLHILYKGKQIYRDNRQTYS